MTIPKTPTAKISNRSKRSVRKRRK